MKRQTSKESARLASGDRPEINLTIKVRWLDMIIDGIKWEEYRAVDNRQCLRLWRECESVGHFPLRPIVAVLRAGYTMDSWAAVVFVHYIARRRIVGRTYTRGGLTNLNADSEHGEWGEPLADEHFALGISPVFHGKYADVKARLEKRPPEQEG